MRTFTVNDKEVQFNAEAFDQAIVLFCRKQRLKIGDVEELVSDKIGVSRETLRNWRKGSNGPSDPELIEKAAERLNVTDWTTLFSEVKTDGGTEMTRLSEKQIEAVKRIYDVCTETLNHFLYLDNVKTMIRKCGRRKEFEPAFDVAACCSELGNRMYLVVDKEYFYLRGTEIYDLLAELTVDIANEVVPSLLTYMDELEQVEELYVRLSEDAARYMQELNRIIEQNVQEG